MKLFLEILLSILLHPVAVVLAWINIAARSDLSMSLKVAWALIVFFVPIVGPILYIVASEGTLW
jgi:hypothetical protein